MAAISAVGTANFGNEVFHSPMPVVVDLYADWCGPCRALTPVLERFACSYAGRVKFVKVNVDQEPDVAAYFQAGSIPTQLVFDQGRLVSRITGMPDPRAFVALLDQLGAKPPEARKRPIETRH